MSKNTEATKTSALSEAQQREVHDICAGEIERMLKYMLRGLQPVDGTAITPTPKPTTPVQPTSQTPLDKTEAAIKTAHQIAATQDAFGEAKKLHQIRDLQDGMKRINVEAKIVEIGNKRQVNAPGGPTELANAIIADETGSISLPLWGEQIDRFQVGNQITLANGYVSSYKGDLQLNVGKWGKLEAKP